MAEEAIGEPELKMIASSQNAEPPGKPEPSPPQTNWMGTAVTRKQAIIAQIIILSLVMSVQGIFRAEEKRDIASVRAEQKASSEAILTRIDSNNAGAIERSGKITKSIDQLTGKLDALVIELTKESSGGNAERKSDGRAP